MLTGMKRMKKMKQFHDFLSSIPAASCNEFHSVSPVRWKGQIDRRADSEVDSKREACHSSKF
jgi:hypothetical protein